MSQVPTGDDEPDRQCPGGWLIPDGEQVCRVIDCPACRSGVGAARPVADPYETLALQVEHLLTVRPHRLGRGWLAHTPQGVSGQGATIGDAVRACAARVRGEVVQDDGVEFEGTPDVWRAEGDQRPVRTLSCGACGAAFAVTTFDGNVEVSCLPGGVHDVRYRPH
jgi:hypothetical protein